MPPKRVAATKAEKNITRCSLCFHGKANDPSNMTSRSVFLEDANVPTEIARPLGDILGRRSLPNKRSTNAQACKFAADTCAAITWITQRHIRPHENYVEQFKRLWNRPFEKLVQTSKLFCPDSISRGPLLHLRTVAEIAASTNVSFSREARGVYQEEKEILQKLEGAALSDTLKYHDKLSMEELWFLVRRGAADAKVRKHMYPGRYLQRWRQLLMDILRVRNCQTRVARALQRKRIPAELVEMVQKALIELEGIPRPSEWADVWLVEKPPLPSPETILAYFAGEQIATDYRRHGELVWDPLTRRFAWVWTFFGGAVYYGHEPSFHFDPFQKAWVPNQKQIEMFGKVFVPKQLLYAAAPL